MRTLPLALAATLTCSLALAAGSVHAAPPAKAAKPAAATPAAKYDQAKLTALEAKLAKNPKDAKLKVETAEANFQVGFAMEHNPDLAPRVKYPGALRRFRRTLQLNPGHSQAAALKAEIEGIYRQMGRPIPK